MECKRRGHGRLEFCVCCLLEIVLNDVIIISKTSCWLNICLHIRITCTMCSVPWLFGYTTLTRIIPASFSNSIIIWRVYWPFRKWSPKQCHPDEGIKEVKQPRDVERQEWSEILLSNTCTHPVEQKVNMCQIGCMLKFWHRQMQRTRQHTCILLPGTVMVVAFYAYVAFGTMHSIWRLRQAKRTIVAARSSDKNTVSMTMMQKW